MPLIDSDTWNDKFIPLNQLRFHPANPRLPELNEKASEREIIHEMCARARVESLARMIADKGYFRQDRLIVFKDGARHVVYEGNRRLCALKVLANPELAPDAMQKTFRRLAEKAKLPKRIAVEIVPTMFDAEVVMFAKHAGELFTVDWKPIQQAAFIAAKLDQGETIESLCDAHKWSRDEVVQARAVVDLYRMSRCAPLSEKAKQLVDDPQQYPYSVVYERLFKPKAARAALGVEFTDKGMVVNSTKEKFLPILARVLEDAVSNDIDTRTLHSERDQLEYVEKLGFKPGGGKLTADTLEEEKKFLDAQDGTKKRAAAALRRRTVRPSGRVFPHDLVSEHGHEKLHRMLDEGKRMEIDGAEHAAAFLLRGTLEIALGISLRARKLWHEARKLETSSLGPSLNVMLDYVNSNRDKFNFDPSAISAIEALVSRKIKTSKAELDRIVHSPDVTATAETVIHIRELVVAVLRELLRLPT